MAELATLARPYAEALFQVAATGDLKQATEQIDALAAVAANPQMRQFAGDPKVGDTQVFDVMAAVVATRLSAPLSSMAQNLLRTVIDNDRLAVLPAIAAQLQVLVNEHSGVADATVYSAFPIEPAQLAELAGVLEKHFGRKLNASVQLAPELIGGIRVVVGDEVFDTSVKARLEQMKAALTA
ncbi:MAG: F0F1 ATP synthase subunit delta [Burkholderiaceae bacterium]